MQARVGKNQTIILERKRLVDFHQSLEEDLRASKADYAAGRYVGPFDTADELMKALTSSSDRQTAPRGRRKRSVSVRRITSTAHAGSRLK